MYMAEVVAIIATAVTAIARVVEAWLKKIEESAAGGCNRQRKRTQQTQSDPVIEKQPRCCS
jgi:hypothetical protein